MIGLTRRTGEHCRLDPDHIERVEAGSDTVVITTDGSCYCIRETIDQVITRIIEYRASDIAACYVLDRGEDADPLGLGGSGVPPQAHAPGPVVPIRLPRPQRLLPPRERGRTGSGRPPSVHGRTPDRNTDPARRRP